MPTDNAALPCAVAGDAHRAGQRQGSVRGISQVGVQVLPNGAYITIGFIVRGNAGGLVMQRAFYAHGHKAGAFHCVGGFLVALIFRKIRMHHLLAACQHQCRHYGQPRTESNHATTLTQNRRLGELILHNNANAAPGISHKILDAPRLSWHTHTGCREHPRRYSWKTPPGPRGSNGIQTMLVGVLFPAVFCLQPGADALEWAG